MTTMIAQANLETEDLNKHPFDLKCEQTKVSEAYYSGHRKAKSLDEQFEILIKYLGDIDTSLNKVQERLLTEPSPEGSEGYFAVLFDQTMIISHEDDESVDQSGPVTRILQALSKQRRGCVVNHWDKLDQTHYRRKKKSAEMMRQLWESQGCPTAILLIPAQLGFKHIGKSNLHAEMEIDENEIMLDACEALQLVLTHSDRFKDDNDLCMDLAGSECSVGANRDFRHALSVTFGSHRLNLFCYEAGVRNSRYGLVTGFLPR